MAKKKTKKKTAKKFDVNQVQPGELAVVAGMMEEG
jgi:hypothetical protein